MDAAYYWIRTFVIQIDIYSKTSVFRGKTYNISYWRNAFDIFSLTQSHSYKFLPLCDLYFLLAICIYIYFFCVFAYRIFNIFFFFYLSIIFNSSHTWIGSITEFFQTQIHTCGSEAFRMNSDRNMCHIYEMYAWNHFETNNSIPSDFSIKIIVIFSTLGIG